MLSSLGEILVARLMAYIPSLWDILVARLMAYVPSLWDILVARLMAYVPSLWVILVARLMAYAPSLWVILVARLMAYVPSLWDILVARLMAYVPSLCFCRGQALSTDGGHLVHPLCSARYLPGIYTCAHCIRVGGGVPCRKRALNDGILPSCRADRLRIPL